MVSLPVDVLFRLIFFKNAREFSNLIWGRSQWFKMGPKVQKPMVYYWIDPFGNQYMKGNSKLVEMVCLSNEGDCWEITHGFPSQPCSITNMFRVGAIRHSFTSQKAAQYVGELSNLCFRLVNLLLKGCKETRRRMARERRGAISSSVIIKIIYTRPYIKDVS